MDDQYSFMDILDRSLQENQYELFDDEENDDGLVRRTK
tara:strand:- start:446 stop:559 length:114 start_codon:yes stop_codon:yes gene_type:complete